MNYEKSKILLSNGSSPPPPLSMEEVCGSVDVNEGKLKIRQQFSS